MGTSRRWSLMPASARSTVRLSGLCCISIFFTAKQTFRKSSCLLTSCSLARAPIVFWDAPECAYTELPGFDLRWLPKGLPPQIRSVQRGYAVGIEVDTLVGSVPLLNGDTLQLRPKVR